MQIIIFLIIFSLIVTIHEFGHFYFAKKTGVLVREFAIGMGPKIFSTHKGETTYTIRMLPLGGYVRLAGYGDDVEPLKAGQLVSILQTKNDVIMQINTTENAEKAEEVPFEIHHADLEKEMILVGKFPNQDEVVTLNVSSQAILIEPNGTRIQVAPLHRQFQNINVLGKMLVNFGGPLMNFILGIILFVGLAFASGGVRDTSNLITVMPEGVASSAGLKTGDRIIAINDVTITDWNAILSTLGDIKNTDANSKVSVVIETENQDIETIDTRLKDGYLGISPYVLTGFMDKLSYGFKETWHIATSILSTLANMFTKGFDINQFGGPVAIAQATGEVSNQGFFAIVWFTAMLSVNLGVMNLLPIPFLDGGKIILNMIELLRGKPISQEKETIVTLIGVGLMIILMLVVSFNDIIRLFK